MKMDHLEAVSKLYIQRKHALGVQDGGPAMIMLYSRVHETVRF